MLNYEQFLNRVLKCLNGGNIASFKKGGPNRKTEEEKEERSERIAARSEKRAKRREARADKKLIKAEQKAGKKVEKAEARITSAKEKYQSAKDNLPKQEIKEIIQETVKEVMAPTENPALKDSPKKNVLWKASKEFPGAEAGKEYTVKKGDTLWGLAKATGTTVKELQETNGITDPKRMLIGTKLMIPGSGSQGLTKEEIAALRLGNDEIIEEASLKPYTEVGLVKPSISLTTGISPFTKQSKSLPKTFLQPNSLVTGKLIYGKLFYTNNPGPEQLNYNLNLEFNLPGLPKQNVNDDLAIMDDVLFALRDKIPETIEDYQIFENLFSLVDDFQISSNKSVSQFTPEDKLMLFKEVLKNFSVSEATSNKRGGLIKRTTKYK